MELHLDARVLREAAVPVDGPLEYGFIKAMFGLMRMKNGVGLAAPQVGYSLSMFITDVPGDKPRVYINPNLVSVSEETTVEQEGCLSLPGWAGTVRRPKHVTIQAFDKRAASSLWKLTILWRDVFYTNTTTYAA